MRVLVRRFKGSRGEVTPTACRFRRIVVLGCEDFLRLRRRLPDSSLTCLRDWHKHANGEMCQEWELRVDALLP